MFRFCVNESESLENISEIFKALMLSKRKLFDVCQSKMFFIGRTNIICVYYADGKIYEIKEIFLPEQQ